MTLHRDDLDRAVQDGVLTRAQADTLWERTGERELPAAPPVDPLRAAGIALAATAGAVVFGVALLGAWERIGPAAGLTMALLEGAGLTIAAYALGHRRGLHFPAALLAALAVPLAPAAVRAAQVWAGAALHDAPPPVTIGGWIASPAFLPAAAAVAAAIAALRAVPSPVLTAVLVATGWCAAMTAAPVVFGGAPSASEQALVSAFVGVVALLAAGAVDGRLRRDHALALYCTGLAALCGGVTTLHADTGFSLLAAVGIYALLVVAGLVLRRRCFGVFGALGIAAGLARVVIDQLDDRVVPVALAGIAAGLVVAAVLYDRLAPAWQRALAAAIPAPARRLLPPRVR